MQKVKTPAYFLFLLTWLLATMPNGLVVLCLKHHSQPQFELGHQADCSPVQIDTYLSCDLDFHEPCMEQKDCTDIPICLNTMIAPNLVRQYQANLLAVMPVQFNPIASDAMGNRLLQVSLSPFFDEIWCTSDSEIVTDSIVLVI